MDSRLDRNQSKEKRPSLEAVLEEIKMTRSRNNQHQNDEADAFRAKTSDDFPLLGLITRRSDHLMAVKGKPISLKTRSKGAVDVTIRNTDEFSNFLKQGRFQRQHISSLLSQCFDPCFTFNAVYHNVARLINRRVIKSVSHTMPMTHRIQKDHYPLLRKLAQLFFETQTLTAKRYLLLEGVTMKNMRNYLLGFSDGSNQFSTSCVYLVSCDTTSDRCQTTLIMTSSKLSEDTLILQTPESIPNKEMHGLLLCAQQMQ